MRYELTTPEQHMALTGIDIDWYVIRAIWDGGSERHGTYGTREAAELALALAEAEERKHDIQEESRRSGEIPSTLVDVCDMGGEVLVHVETVCGLYRESHKVATFATMLDATAYVASTYGLTRQACDGDSAHAGWWLS